MPRARTLQASLDELRAAIQQAIAEHSELAVGPHGRKVLRMGGEEVVLRGSTPVQAGLVESLCQKLSVVAAYGLATALTDSSPGGTRLRMDLITALAVIEGTPSAQRERDHSDDVHALLTTAEAAAQLGMSRPYIAILCDQGKLGQVSRSEGGHRRIRQTAVDEYKRMHLVPGTGPD